MKANNTYKHRGLILLLAVLAATTVSAQFRYRGYTRGMMGGENFHFAYLSFGVGYSSLVENLPEMDPTGGFGWNVGAGYEYRNNAFWLSIGLGVSQHHSTADINWEEDIVFKQFKAIDRYGNGFTPVFHDVKQADTHEITFVDIPLLLGYYTKGFHVGVGPKVGFGAQSKLHTSGSFELRGRYEKFAEDIYGIPDRGFTNYDYEGESKLQMIPEISLCGEIGYDVLSRMWTKNPMCHILKVSFYFEYGLNSLIQPLNKNEHLVIDGKVPVPGREYNLTKAGFQPYLGSCTTGNPMVFPFYTGARITYMIGGSQHGGRKMMHQGCSCYDF